MTQPIPEAVAGFSQQERDDARAVFLVIASPRGAEVFGDFDMRPLAAATGFDLQRVAVALEVLEAAGLIEKSRAGAGRAEVTTKEDDLAFIARLHRIPYDPRVLLESDFERLVHLACGALPRVKPGEKWIAELVDESNPDSAVCVRRADGDRSGAMTMPQEVYWAMREAETSYGGREMRYGGADLVVLPPTLAHLKP